MKRLACALVLAGLTCAMVTSARDARAAQARASGGLQLAIITPDPNSIGDRVSVDVSFRGSAVETIELYLDNALVAKRLLNTAQTRGMITFAIETAKLSEGAHELRVAAFSADGKPAVANTRLRIPAADLSAPVRISYPLNGTPVAGIVAIRVSLDSEVQKQKPYVSFWVDKELKVLRNYPPYEYNWDTSKVTNGWHVLEAWSQTDDALTPMKARAINVNVNNATGETKKQDSIQDLNNEQPDNKTITMVPTVDPKTAKTGTASANPSIVPKDTVGISNGTRPVSADNGARTVMPGSQDLAATSAPKANPAIALSINAKGNHVPAKMGGAVSEPTTRMAVASAQKATLPNIAGAREVAPITSHIRATANIAANAVKPSGSVAHAGQHAATGAIAIDTNPSIKNATVKPMTIAKAMTVQPTKVVEPTTAAPVAKPVQPTAVKHPVVAKSLVMPKSGAFDVAFNGYLIAFDVQPRIQDGMGLAPFRQIFEHTGGRLYWYGGSVQAVRAVNDSREIEIKIGDPNVLINNRPLSMEKAPYIVHGRTIVPMSFIRDALDVQVRYDTKSGRVLIESK